MNMKHSNFAVKTDSIPKRIEYILEGNIDHCSFHIDSMPLTLQTMIFRYNYKSNVVFYSPNSFYKVYLTALKNSKLKWIV